MEGPSLSVPFSRQKSNLIVDSALHALALASMDLEEELTLDLVENDWVVKLDE